MVDYWTMLHVDGVAVPDLANMLSEQRDRRDTEIRETEREREERDGETEREREGEREGERKREGVTE